MKSVEFPELEELREKLENYHWYDSVVLPHSNWCLPAGYYSDDYIKSLPTSPFTIGLDDVLTLGFGSFFSHKRKRERKREKEQEKEALLQEIIGKLLRRVEELNQKCDRSERKAEDLSILLEQIIKDIEGEDDRE